MLSSEMPQVTVAVVVRDRRERMMRCLEAILAQDHPSFEVVVIDNCSTDGTAEAVKERGATAPVAVTVVIEPGSVGHLRNVATRLANGEILAFTDSDCAPAPGWLAAGEAALHRDRRVGIVQGRTLPDNDDLGAWPNTQQITEPNLYFECCNIFYRLDALRASDGFDETTRLSAFGEDTAAGWSVMRQGWRRSFEPSALVHHDVTYPGLVWHLRRALRYEAFPALVRQYPEMRDHFFWHRWFLSRRYAAFFGAVVGILLALRWRPTLLLALPYAWWRRPAAPGWRFIRGQFEGTLYDAAGFTGLVRGSIRHRRVVL